MPCAETGGIPWPSTTSIQRPAWNCQRAARVNRSRLAGSPVFSCPWRLLSVGLSPWASSRLAPSADPSGPSRRAATARLSEATALVASATYRAVCQRSLSPARYKAIPQSALAEQKDGLLARSQQPPRLTRAARRTCFTPPSSPNGHGLVSSSRTDHQRAWRQRDRAEVVLLTQHHLELVVGS